MESMLRVGALLLLLAGCSSPVATGGSAGAGGSAGEPAGSGGTGGADQGTGGMGGVGGGSTGGAGGEEPPDFDPGAELGLPGKWEFVRLKQQPDKFWLFEGLPGTLGFPKPTWESCGPGCESTDLTYADGAHRVVVSSEPSASGEADVVASMAHVLPGEKVRLQRVVRLSDGLTLGALLSYTNEPGPHPRFNVMQRLEGARSRLMTASLGRGSDEAPLNILYLTLDAHTGRWIFREPWDGSQYRASTCKQFDLDSSPAAYLFACPRGLEVMAEAGSSAIMTIPNSENAMTGVGNFGEAVWVEHDLELPFSSRIRAWSPGNEARTLAEIPDFVCGLGIGPDRVVGLRGTDERWGQGCSGGLAEARFFEMPREGGEIRESPILPGVARRASSVSVYGDWMVARMGLPPTEFPQWSIAIVRLSDWAVREIWQPEGRSFSKTSVAIDDEYFYYTQEYSMPGKHGFDRLFRYRLDHFDQIGEPMFPSP